MADDLVPPPSPSYISDPPPPDPNARALTPLGLYSHAADVVNRMPQMKGTPQQFKAMLLKQGVKPDELKWSKFDEAHAGKPMVTKQELKQHFEKNLPPLEETELGEDDPDKADQSGAPRYGEYTLPGGKNYRELLMHTPPGGRAELQKYHALHRQVVDATADWKDAAEQHGHTHPQTNEAFKKLAALEDQRTEAHRVHQEAAKANPDYGSSHWDTPNVVAHLRMSDRKDGKQKILHVEELQSDWAQEGRKDGFTKPPLTAEELHELDDLKKRRGPASVDPQIPPEEYARMIELNRRRSGISGVPIAPYVDSTQKWVDLGLKRVLHEAAKGGYDKVVFTPGEEQAKRYDLSQHLSELHHWRVPGHNLIGLSAYAPEGHAVLDQEEHKPEALSGLLGHELAQRILAGEGDKNAEHSTSDTEVRTLRGDGLKIGGEGMKAFYDKVVPQSLEKLARKHDPAAKVQMHGHINTSEKYTKKHPITGVPTVSRIQHKLHSIDITPKMRESILKGQPAYAAGGAVQTQPDLLARFHEAIKHTRKPRAEGGRIGKDELAALDQHVSKLRRETGTDKPTHVNIPGIGKIEAKPIPAIEKTALKFARHDKLYSPFRPFNEGFARKVADAFDKLKDNPHDPHVKRAYDALIDETMQQYRAAKDSGIDFKFLKPGDADPYAKSPSLGYADILHKGKLHVFPTDAGFGSGEKSGNPLLKRVGKVGDLPNATANDAFRIVHDLYGHFGPGNPFFRAPGEERAYQLHSRMYSPEARKAAATETRGQNSWVNFGPAAEKNKGASGADTVYAPQKAGILPDWAQSNEFKRGGTVAIDDGDDHPAWIPTRLVTSKKGSSERGHIVDMASFRETPELFQKNIDLLRAYPNMRLSHANKDHEAVAKEMLRHAKDNLLDLHDRVPAEIRDRSKRWYDGARRITNDWMQKYQLPDHSIAGALAALSPQKDWYQNVSLSKRVLDTLRGGGENFYKGQTFDKAMEDTWHNRPSLAKPEYEGLVGLLRGKSLHDLDTMGLPPAERAHAKAMWVRMHDETVNNPEHPIITPEGDMGDMVKTDKGSNAKVGWGSLGEIAKAIRAIESAHDPAALSQLMGERHKVRNFYNNILSPNSKHGDVTIDTHAIAAALMRPLSGNSLEVSHNFANHPGKGLPAAGGSALTGTQGTYPLFADAYRSAAKDRGIKPREMQSITWEAVRGLFPDTFKTKSNNAKIDAVWDLYRKGKVSQARARDIIHGIAGGIRPPSWFAGSDEANGRPADAGALPGPGLHGQAAPGAVPGGGSGPAGGIPAEGLIGAQLQKAAGGSVNHRPTDAQKAAGNYAKAHTSFQGIPIAIENKMGSVRSGRDARGKAWSCKLPADYGYIKRTMGADGDHVDCYVGPVSDSHLVVVVNQLGPDRKFDEHKILFGFRSEYDALNCYVKAFSDGKGADRIGSVEVMSLDGFKKWLSSGKTKRRLPPGSIVDHAVRLVSGNTR